MSTTDEFVTSAATYQADFDKGDLPMPPGRKVAVVACMDARLNPYGLLGLTEGDAHVIRNAGGEIENIDIWGRRKLAYEIAGKTEGNYVVVNYTCEPATNDELDRVLNLNESVIRTKILRKDVK